MLSEFVTQDCLQYSCTPLSKNIKYFPQKRTTTPLRIKPPDSHAQLSAVRHKFLSITAIISAHKNDLYITRALVLKFYHQI